MKNLVLIAGAAALVLPVAANAAGYDGKNAKKEQHYTYKKVEDTNADGEYRIEVKSEDNFTTTRNRSHNGTYNLVDGQKLILDGNTAYKVDANGSRFYAPNGSYKTGNLTIVVEDGQLKRIENPAEVVAFSFRDNNRRR